MLETGNKNLEPFDSKRFISDLTGNELLEFRVRKQYYQIRGYKSTTFTIEQTLALLDSPVVDVECILSPKSLERLQAQIDSNPRFSTGFEACEISYSGPWYYQGLDPTCAPMAMLNAAIALGVKVDAELLTKALNLAIPSESNDKAGTKISQILKLLSDYPDLGFKIIDSTHDEGLKMTHVDMTEDQKAIRGGYGDLRPEFAILEGILRFYAQNDEQVLQHNSKIIKENIDAGDVIQVYLLRPLHELEGSRYQAGFPIHSVCISGYKILESGAMDVQIIDSQCGKYWASLEHLSSNIYPSNTAVIQRDS